MVTRMLGWGIRKWWCKAHHLRKMLHHDVPKQIRLQWHHLEPDEAPVTSSCDVTVPARTTGPAETPLSHIAKWHQNTAKIGATTNYKNFIGVNQINSKRWMFCNSLIFWAKLIEFNHSRSWVPLPVEINTKSWVQLVVDWVQQQ